MKTKSFFPILLLLVVAEQSLQQAYDSREAIFFSDNTGFSSDPEAALLTADFTYTPQGSCADVPVTFTSTTAGAIQYIWNFGDGFIDTTTKNTTTHTFLSIGGATQSFNVKLTVTDINGNKDEITKPVVLKQLPDAALINDASNSDTVSFNGLITFRQCSNQFSYDFIFINNSATDATNVQYKITWDVTAAGDTMLDNSWKKGNAVHHTYTIGNKVMQVEVTGPQGCISKQLYNVFLGTDPKGGLENPGDNNYCVDSVVKFPLQAQTYNNPPGTIYKFHVSDNSKDTTFTTLPAYLTHIFRKSSCGQSDTFGNKNSFFAILTMVNPCLPYTSYRNPIHVSSPPTANLQIAPDTLGCTGQSLTFTNTSDAGGLVTPTGECNNKLAQVWMISPKVDYTVSGNSSLGSINGDITKPGNWTSGTSKLQIQFSKPGRYTIKMYTINIYQKASDYTCSNYLDSTEQTVCIQSPPVAGFTMLSSPGCDSSTIAFTNTSVIDNSACRNNVSFQWAVTRDSLQCSNGKQPRFVNSSDTSASPVIAFPEPGYYHVQLSATANASCTSRYDTVLFVKGKPVATILPVGNICLGKSIHPKAGVKNCFSGITKYRWTFVNGNPSFSDSLDPGTISYNSTGIQTIIFTAENECGPSSDTLSFTVTDKPVAFAGNDTAVCSGSQIRLGGSAVPGYKYQWQPQALFTTDAPTLAQPRISLFYTGAMLDTVYTLTLLVSAGDHCDSTDTIHVTVLRQPAVRIQSLLGTVCTGGEDTLVATGAESFSWTDDPSIIRLSQNKDTAFVRPSATIVYTVTGTDNGGSGCSAEASITIGVQSGALAVIAPAGNHQSCTAFNVKDSIGATIYPQDSLYTWHLLTGQGVSLPVQSNTTGAPPDYALSRPGDSVYIFLETTDRSGCSRAFSDTVLFTLGSNAEASFIKDLSRADGCPPDSILFTPQVTGSTMLYWDFGNGSTYTGYAPPQQVYSSDVDTIFTVKLVAASLCRSDSFQSTVQVRGKLAPRLGVNTSDFCVYDSLLVSNQSSDADTFVYRFGDGTSLTTTSAASFYHTYPLRDTVAHYTLTLTALNKCETVTAPPITVTVRPGSIHALISIDSDPLINIKGDSIKGCAGKTTVRIINGSTGADYYLYDFGDGQSLVRKDNETIEHTYTTPGRYTLHISMGNSGCGKADIFKTITTFPVPSADFEPPLVLCTEDTVHITALQSPGQNLFFEWMPDVSGTSVLGNYFAYVYTDSGTHNVTLHTYYFDAVSGTTCSNEKTNPVYISKRPKAVFDYTPKGPKVNVDYVFTYDSVAAATSFTWYFGDGDSLNTRNTNFVTHRYAQERNYYPTLVSHNNTLCTYTYTDSLYAFIKQIVGVPTAFRPNGGQNDYLRPEVHGAISMDFRIYDRWGHLIYQTTDMQDEGWNGYYQGALQPADVYGYILDVTYADNSRYTKRGGFTLLR